MFGRKSIQMLVSQKWMQVVPIMKYGLFLPHMVMLFCNLAWHIWVRPFRDTAPYDTWNRFFVVLQLMQVSYFFLIEVLQMSNGLREYLSDTWNLFDMLPLFSIVQSTIVSEFQPALPPDQSSDLFNVTIDVIGTLLLWYGAYYYLRIWNEAGYLARMITEVIIDMKMFFMIYIMYHLSFA